MDCQRANFLATYKMVVSFPFCAILQDGEREIFSAVLSEGRSESSSLIFALNEVQQPNQSIFLSGITTVSIASSQKYEISQSNYLAPLLVLKTSYFTSGRINCEDTTTPKKLCIDDANVTDEMQVAFSSHMHDWDIDQLRGLCSFPGSH